jgi:hypothetical protein
MGILGIGVVLDVEAFFCEEMCAEFSGVFPFLSESLFIIYAPGIELLEWREFRMCAEKF